MTIGFIESPVFPDFVSAWAIGGAGWKTTVVETDGGNEYRNAAWAQPRAAFEIQNAWTSTDPKNSAYNWTATQTFFMTCMGQLGAFRFRDPRDYTDGGAGVFVMLTPTTFQMYKSYSYSPNTLLRIIQKPRSPTVVVTGGVGATVDYTTGIVTVSSGTPGSWTGQFDVPCRFANDAQAFGLDESTGAQQNWQSLKIIEIRNF